MNPADLCMGCMEPRSTAGACPRCGWHEGTAPESPLHLPAGTALHDQYVLGRVLGHGGFGITYLAWELNLACKLAVKEYLPHGVAARTTGDTTVRPFSAQARQDYEWGLEKFLDEARTLARFQQTPGIASVRNFFRANGTAYLVMEYLDGITLATFLDQNNGRLPFQTVVNVMAPVMEALSQVHGAGILHRDVSPDNIFLTRTGKVKLLDFGAARYALGQQSRNLSVILKEGYAPEEQYRTKGVQGPWTDVYATAATSYRCLTGQIPPPSLDRMSQDELVSPRALGVDIDERVEQCILKGLAVRQGDRYQSIEDFYAAITGRGEQGTAWQPQHPPKPAPAPQPVPPPKPVSSSGVLDAIKHLPAAVWISLGVLLVLGIVYSAMRPSSPPAPAPEASLPNTPSPNPVSNDTTIPKQPEAPAPSPPPAGDDSGSPRNAAAADVTFAFSPSEIDAGEQTLLKWSVPGASQVAVAPGIGRSPSQGVRPLRPQKTQTYTLMAQTPQGTIRRTATITVRGAASGSGTASDAVRIAVFQADPNNVPRGQTAVLHWLVQGDVASVSIAVVNGYGRSPGPVEASGTVSVSPQTTTTYRLNAFPRDGGPPQTRDVNVVVLGSNNTDNSEGGPPAQGPIRLNTYVVHLDLQPGSGPVKVNSGYLKVEGDWISFQPNSGGGNFRLPLSTVSDAAVNPVNPFPTAGAASFHIAFRNGKFETFFTKNKADDLVNTINAARRTAR